MWQLLRSVILPDWYVFNLFLSDGLVTNFDSDLQFAGEPDFDAHLGGRDCKLYFVNNLLLGYHFK